MTKRHTVKEWLTAAKKQIPSLDAELIALTVFDSRYADRSWLVAHDTDHISARQRAHADHLVEERLRGAPLAYIINTREFYGRRFYVTDKVLIPRPETEALIDLVKELPDLPNRPHIFDLGTGSGCIAITLALEIPSADVFATDIGRDTLVIAELNDRHFEGRVTFHESDMLTNISMEYEGAFDVLVTNLPYVNPNWDFINLAELEREPAGALFAFRENGLSIYHRLFDELSLPPIPVDTAEWIEYRKGKATPFKTQIHYLVVEADPCQHDALIKMAATYGWEFLKKKDYGLAFVNHDFSRGEPGLRAKFAEFDRCCFPPDPDADPYEKREYRWTTKFERYFDEDEEDEEGNGAENEDEDEKYMDADDEDSIEYADDEEDEDDEEEEEDGDRRDDEDEKEDGDNE